MRSHALLLLATLAPASWGADWANGQAARAVIGQSSFSAHEGGFDPTSLSLVNGQLYVADTSGRVLTFDLSPVFSKVLTGSDNGTCAVCVNAPVGATTQSVPAAGARFALFRHSVAIADAAHHRVLFWRDTSRPSAAAGPDVVLDDPGVVSDPSSVALDAQYLYVGDKSAHRVLIWRTSALKEGQAPEAVLGQREVTSREDSNVSAASISTPSALLSDGSNLFVADLASHRVLVFTPGEAVVKAEDVLSTANLEATSLAPGALVTIHGEHLADSSDSANDNGQDPMPETLAGAQVLLDGRPLPLIAVSPQEIRTQIPYTINYTSSASLCLHWTSGKREDEDSAPIALSVEPVAPAIFAFPGDGGPRNGVLLHAPSSASGVAGSPVTTDEPAHPGEILVVWASGLGSVLASDAVEPIAGMPYSSAPATVRAEVEALVNNEPVDVLSAILPHRAIGIYEVRVLLPRSVPSEFTLSLRLREGTESSNTVSVPIGTLTEGSTIHD